MSARALDGHGRLVCDDMEADWTSPQAPDPRGPCPAIGPDGPCVCRADHGGRHRDALDLYFADTADSAVDMANPRVRVA